MNKRINSISKILLVPFLFSTFNSVYSFSLAMDSQKYYKPGVSLDPNNFTSGNPFDIDTSNDRITDEKKIEYWEIHRPNQIRKNDLQLYFTYNKNQEIKKFRENCHDLVNACIKNYLKQKNSPYSLLLLPYIEFASEIFNYSEEFKKNLVEISRNIYDILLLCPYEQNYEKIIWISITDLINMYFNFIRLELTQSRCYNCKSTKFTYNFNTSPLLKELVKHLGEIAKNSPNKFEIIGNIEVEDKDTFLICCKQLNENISNIISIINNKCAYYKQSSSDISYGAKSYDILISSEFKPF